MLVARADLIKADGQLQEVKSEHQQTVDELETKQELYRRNPGNVPFRDIERLQEREKGQLGAITAATAAKQSAEERISTLLPAEKATAEAELEKDQVELDKTVIRAGVTGRVEQFLLRVGDVVNPLMRPAGILIPEGAGYPVEASLRFALGASRHEPAGKTDRIGRK
jgi:multidrug resistance efflux pump